METRTASPTRDSRRRGATACACLALLTLSGAGYRVMAARFANLSGGVPLPRGTLARLPLRIGDWAGEDTPVNERIIQATDTDDHVSRTYARSAGGNVVSLFIGYGVRFRDLVPHRPEVCYPGAGWTLQESHSAEIRTADGSTVPSRVLRFFRSGLEAQNVTVLNYYIVDGEYCPDVSLLRSKSWRARGDLQYVAQVQVVCGNTADPTGAEDQLRAFAAELAPVLQAVLSEAVARISGSNRADAG